MKCNHRLGFWGTKEGYECVICGEKLSKEEYQKFKKEQEEKIRTCKHINTSTIVGVYQSHTICKDCGTRLD